MHRSFGWFNHAPAQLSSTTVRVSVHLINFPEVRWRFILRMFFWVEMYKLYEIIDADDLG